MAKPEDEKSGTLSIQISSLSGGKLPAGRLSVYSAKQVLVPDVAMPLSLYSSQ